HRALHPCDSGVSRRDHDVADAGRIGVVSLIVVVTVWSRTSRNMPSFGRYVLFLTDATNLIAGGNAAGWYRLDLVLQPDGDSCWYRRDRDGAEQVRRRFDLSP